MQRAAQGNQEASGSFMYSTAKGTKIESETISWRIFSWPRDKEPNPIRLAGIMTYIFEKSDQPTGYDCHPRGALPRFLNEHTKQSS